MIETIFLLIILLFQNYEIEITIQNLYINKENSIGDKLSSLQQNIVFYRQKEVYNTLKKQEPEPSLINVCQPIPNPLIQMQNLHCLVKK